MRRLLKLAILMALGGWVLKRLSEVGKDNVYRERVPWWDQETQLPPQPLEDYRDATSAFPMTEEPDLQPRIEDGSPAVNACSSEEANTVPEAVERVSDEGPPPSLETEPLPGCDVVAENATPSSEEPGAEATEAIPDENVPWSLGQEEHEARVGEEGEASPAVGQDPLGSEAAEHPQERSEDANEWSLSVGPDGEEKFRRTREVLDERLRKLSKRKRDEGNAA